MSHPDDLKSAAEHLAAIVDQWHFDLFHGSIAARETEVWNLIHAAKEELKQRLAAAAALEFHQ